MFAGIIANACPQISGHHKSNNNVAVKGSDGNNFAHNRFWGVVDVLGRSTLKKTEKFVTMLMTPAVPGHLINSYMYLRIVSKIILSAEL